MTVTVETPIIWENTQKIRSLKIRLESRFIPYAQAAIEAYDKSLNMPPMTQKVWDEANASNGSSIYKEFKKRFIIDQGVTPNAINRDAIETAVKKAYAPFKTAFSQFRHMDFGADLRDYIIIRNGKAYGDFERIERQYTYTADTPEKLELFELLTRITSDLEQLDTMAPGSLFDLGGNDLNDFFEIDRKNKKINFKKSLFGI